MAVPRPLLIALIAVIVLAGAFLVLGGSDDEGDVVEPAQTTQPTQTTPGGTTEETGGQTDDGPEDPGIPARVEDALEDNKVVVLFFGQRGGADDAATRRSVDTLEGRERIEVVEDSVNEISDYRRITGSLPVDQAPAVVIVTPDKQASVLEGYVDAGTLRQQVLDTLR